MKSLKYCILQQLLLVIKSGGGRAVVCHRKDKFTDNFRWKKKLQRSIWRVREEQMMMNYHVRMWSGPTPGHERPLASYKLTDVRVSSQADNLLTSRPSACCKSVPLSSTDITTLLSQRHIDGTCYHKVQGAYKLSEDFAKPYFHKYST